MKEDLRKEIPDAYKKARIIRNFVGIAGAAIAGGIIGSTGNYIYAGIVAIIIFIIGIAAGFLAEKKFKLESLESASNTSNLIGGIISLALAILGIISFIVRHD